jgi:hypothetical protein
VTDDPIADMLNGDADDLQPQADGPIRLCQKPTCDNQIAPDAYHTVRYCDEHRKVKKGDRKPTNINFKVGSGGGRSAEAQRKAKVQGGGLALMNMVAAGLALGGDQICAAAVANGADSWAKAMADLSVYQPWIANILAPTGDLTGQMSAWIAATIATAGIAVPVLAHHNMVPPSVAAKFAGVMVMTAATGAEAQQAPVDDPVAA